MATYFEIKQLIGKIFDTEDVIDETSDINIPELSYRDESFVTTLSNSKLLYAYEKMNEYTKEKVELSSAKHREVAIQFMRQIVGRLPEPIIDTENGLTYTFGPASLEYCIFLLSSIADVMKDSGGRLPFELRHYGFMNLKRKIPNQLPENPLDLLPIILRAYTLRIDSTKDISIIKMRSYAISYEFQFMYRKSIAISEYSDLGDMFTFTNAASETISRLSRDQMDSPPKRIYNSDIFDFYIMAIESRDPFTEYISFYHVIEHYFDTVFRKKLTENIREKITSPDFSYKREDKLYELAKYIRKHMDSDDESGKGNEFDSLKYVLNEYVPIDDLKKRIAALDSTAIAYYQNTFVPFTSGNKTKISWNDSPGVYTNLANRIYDTRNALVHSKSEKAQDQYRPYKNSNDLRKEIALIRAVAELVIINSSEIL